MEKIILAALERENNLKPNALRTKDFVPAILYGHNVKNLPLQIKYSDLSKAYKTAGTTTLVDLKIGNDTRTVLIHELTRNPVSDRISHADFYQVKLDEKIKAEIPLNFVGESPAVKELEGTLINNKNQIQVEAFPQDLVHEIEVDISGLKTFEDTILIKDINTPKGIEILDDPEETVALVNPPRSEEELAELDKEISEDVEAVEVEEKGKIEEEGAGDAETGETPESPKPESTQKEEK